MAPKDELIARFQRLFRGRESYYGQWAEDDTKTREGPIPQTAWAKHLAGKGPFLGIVPVTEENLCYWGAIDVDDTEVNHAALAAIIQHADLPLVVCRSKSGGAHLFLFLKDPARASAVRDKLLHWAQVLGLKNAEQDVNGKRVRLPVEVFPKNGKLKPTEQGSWINLPYYGNGTTNRYAVTEAGDKLTLDDFIELAEQRQVSALELEIIEPGGDNPFAAGPPCLQTLHGQGIPEGSRNMGLFNIALFFKLQNEATWKDEVADYNDTGKLDPPLSKRDVQAVIKSVEHRDYIYKCSELPIQPFCKKKECKKQPFGISAFGKRKREQAMPELGNLRKLTSDPPRWTLTVAGQDVDMTTEDLLNITRFQKLVLERCDLIVPAMRSFEWHEIVSELLVNKTIIEAPPDAGIFGFFKYLVGEFLIRRRSAEGRQDLLRGLPLEEGARVIFRSTDLLAFLDRKKFRAYEPNQVFDQLRHLGAGHEKLKINDQAVQIWYVPLPDDESEFKELEERPQVEPEY